MTQHLMLKLDDETFQYLEVLAYGLNQERFNGDKHNETLMAGFNKPQNHFGPLVSRLLEDMARSVATGVRRPGSWERGCLDSLTGWQGTVNRGMFGPLVEISGPDLTPVVWDSKSSS